VTSAPACPLVLCPASCSKLSSDTFDACQGPEEAATAGNRLSDRHASQPLTNLPIARGLMVGNT